MRDDDRLLNLPHVEYGSGVIGVCDVCGVRQAVIVLQKERFKLCVLDFLNKTWTHTKNAPGAPLPPYRSERIWYSTTALPGGRAPALLLSPTRPVRHPVALVTPDLYGITTSLLDGAIRLAREGFEVMLPDIAKSDGIGPGTHWSLRAGSRFGGGVPSSSPAVRTLTGLYADALTALREREMVDPAKTALVGLSYGGSLATILASQAASVGALALAYPVPLSPPELPRLVTAPVFLALGAWRLSKSRVLTRRVPAVEALGAITVLAVDKTGTLTQNRMQVAELAAGDAVFLSSASDLPEPFHTLVEFAMLATPLDPFDPMEKAIQGFGHTRLANTEHVHDDRSPAHQYDLARDILAITRVFADTHPDTYVLATKGAPEAVADLCHLPEPGRAAIQRQVEAMATRGLRVLGVARGTWQAPAPGAPWPASQHDFDFTFLGLIGLLDPPRPEVPAAIAECRAAGVRIVMMTGDHPATARAIAAQVGLSDRAEVVTGPELAALDDAALRERLRRVDVCARLAPEHKLRLVRALQADGQVVAMTGDGVNDAPALKAADVGIAMGERGTDVAREAAALVLLDDSFASIVQAIRGGRRIFDNIAKATRFVFAVHMPIIALTLLPALLHWPVLLLPVHIVLLELLIDPACSIVFEAEPAAADLMRRPPRPLSASPFTLGNIGYALAQGLGIAAVLLAGHALLHHFTTWSEADLRLVVFTALVLALFLLILANRDLAHAALANLRGDNPWLARMFVGVALVLAAVMLIPGLRAVMGFASVGLPPLAAALGLLIACGLWLQTLRWADGWRLHWTPA